MASTIEAAMPSERKTGSGPPPPAGGQPPGGGAPERGGGARGRGWGGPGATVVAEPGVVVVVAVPPPQAAASTAKATMTREASGLVMRETPSGTGNDTAPGATRSITLGSRSDCEVGPHTELVVGRGAGHPQICPRGEVDGEVCGCSGDDVLDLVYQSQPCGVCH